jgi:hypothetical protein
MDVQTIEAQQDALRPVRQFIGLIGGAVAGYDNATAASDYGVYNVPGGYQVIGPYGVSVEGTPYGLPISPTRGGGLFISPTAVLIGIGVALAMFWKQ